MRRFTLLISLVAVLLSLTACSGMSQIMGGVGEIAGIEMPKTEEVQLSVASVCPKCKPETHSTINPFPEPVSYTKVGIAEIDGFVESANNIYGTVLVLDRMVNLGQQIADNPNMQIEGFTGRDEVLSLATTMFETASQDVPNLVTQGTAMVTNVASLATDPKNALVAPTAVEQVKLAVERLNEAQEKLTSIASSMTGGGEE